MQDIIELLPDNIANQIAAGEVIQRPASAVKELLENAVDAGATQIHLIISDAGKELIKVIDNGKGMSHTDARLCFERHATSKIKKIEDLFTIRTMGFRGEALASIAAVAQVELKTKQSSQDAGTCIQIENSAVQKQEVCASANGTTISVKNLFYNIPARRNFLKGNNTEIKHIIDEFTRVAMAFPNIGFKLTNNNTDLFICDAGSLKQRIVALLGNNFNSKLVPVTQDTEYLKVNGFVGTPDIVSKTRGNQFFFVNNRFIKSAYLNHAVQQAFDQLIPKDAFAAYILFLELDPSKIDANVHPTKQEIKFEDERIIYSFLNSAIKQSLSKNSIAPSIDFDLSAEIANLPSITQPFTSTTRDEVIKNTLYQNFTQPGQAHFIEKSTPQWQRAFTIVEDINTARGQADDRVMPAPVPTAQIVTPGFIAYPKQNGFLLINIKNAIERIEFDKINIQQQLNIQKLLHPITFNLSKTDAHLFLDILPTLEAIGIEVEPFGTDAFIIQGLQTDIPAEKAEQTIQEILEQLKHDAQLKVDSKEKVLKTRAWQKALYANKNLSALEIQTLCEKLFASTQPQFTPRGAKIFVEINLTDFEKDFAAV